MVAGQNTDAAKLIAKQVADEIERQLLAVMLHGFGDVSAKINVTNGQVSVIRCDAGLTFKPSLN